MASCAIVGSLVGFGVTGDDIGVETLSSETTEEGSKVLRDKNKQNYKREQN